MLVKRIAKRVDKQVFELALKLRPTAAPGWVALGTIRAREGDQEKAVAAFEAALQCDPRYGDTRGFYRATATGPQEGRNIRESLMVARC